MCTFVVGSEICGWAWDGCVWGRWVDVRLGNRRPEGKNKEQKNQKRGKHKCAFLGEVQCPRWVAGARPNKSPAGGKASRALKSESQNYPLCVAPTPKFIPRNSPRPARN